MVRLWNYLTPEIQRTLISIIVFSIYSMGMLLLITVPLQSFLLVTEYYSTSNGSTLHLSRIGEYLLIVVMAMTFGWSVAVGGFARTFFNGKHLQGLWLVFLGLMLLIGITAVFDNTRAAIGDFAATRGGDNSKVTTFIAFWLLMVGYAGKAVWDEARDRMSKLLEAISLPS